MSLSLSAIIKAIGGELHGNPAREVFRLAPLETATPDDISFLVPNPRLKNLLAQTKAGCVIIAPVMQATTSARGDCIISPDPYLYFARLTQLWKRAHQPPTPAGIHPNAVVEEGALVHSSASIGALCFVGRGASIGADTVLRERVTVASGCFIGERCLIESGAVIGGDGFGFAPHQGQWVKIEQLGGVRIGNDVEIGANTCIDRGALDDTVIEDGVKLDNLIQIGHNTRIGAHTVMAGCVGVAGSARIGAHCTVGGAGMILGHLDIADHVHISAASMVARSITRPGHYTGFFPIDDNAAWEKNAASLKHLHALRERVRQIEKKLAEKSDNLPLSG